MHNVERVTEMRKRSDTWRRSTHRVRFCVHRSTPGAEGTTAVHCHRRPRTSHPPPPAPHRSCCQDPLACGNSSLAHQVHGCDNKHVGRAMAMRRWPMLCIIGRQRRCAAHRCLSSGSCDGVSGESRRSSPVPGGGASIVRVGEMRAARSLSSGACRKRAAHRTAPRQNKKCVTLPIALSVRVTIISTRFGR